MVLLTWVRTELQILCHLNLKCKDVCDFWVMWFKYQISGLIIFNRGYIQVIQEYVIACTVPVCVIFQLCWISLHLSRFMYFSTMLNGYMMGLCLFKETWRLMPVMSCGQGLNVLLFVKLNSVVIFVYLFVSLSSLIIVNQWVIDPTFPQHGCG
jgi:hypothetical protein